MKNIVRYFVNGLVIIVPVGIIALIIERVISLFHGVTAKFGGIVNPSVDTLIVFISVLIFITLLGVLGGSIIFRPVFSFFDQALEKTPVVKTVYSSVKDILEAFVGSKKKFNVPVMVAMNESKTLHQLGFITHEDLSHLHLPSDKVAVYLPSSYSFAGKLVLVNKELVTRINANAGEVMKFILSGGITDID